MSIKFLALDDQSNVAQVRIVVEAFDCFQEIVLIIHYDLHFPLWRTSPDLHLCAPSLLKIAFSSCSAVFHV